MPFNPQPMPGVNSISYVFVSKVWSHSFVKSGASYSFQLVQHSLSRFSLTCGSAYQGFWRVEAIKPRTLPVHASGNRSKISTRWKHLSLFFFLSQCLSLSWNNMLLFFFSSFSMSTDTRYIKFTCDSSHSFQNIQ